MNLYLYSPVQNCLKQVKEDTKELNYEWNDGKKWITKESNNKAEREWRCLKFSAVLGAISAKSSILMRPAGMVPMVMSKKTTGFLGFGGRTCHSTPPPPPAFPPPDAIELIRQTRTHRVTEMSWENANTAWVWEIYFTSLYVSFFFFFFWVKRCK